MLKLKLLFLCVANTVLVASLLFKDKAFKKWSFCHFKEGEFENIYQHLQIKEKPKSPLYCSIPFYEWHTDRPPLFKDVSSDMTFILDRNGEEVDPIATFWSHGGISPSGSILQIILRGIQEVDLSKYSLYFFANSYLDMEGLFFQAKYPEVENLVYVHACMLCNYMDQETLISESRFLALWDEHIQGKDTLTCHDDSDNDDGYLIEL